MILNQIKSKIKNFLTKINKKDNAQNNFMLGSIYFEQVSKNYNNLKELQDAEYKVFSQTGEDGIINYLFSKLNISNAKFVEIGVGDYSESNTRFIYENSFSKGLIVDIEKDFKKKVSQNINLWKGLLEIENTEITSENINSVLDKYNLNKNLDLFSLDIDGVDYWVLKNMNKRISKLFVVEYNPTFGHNLEITVPNVKNFNRFKSHYSGCYYGASLKAIIKMMDSKGYEFIGTNKLNFNAFFVVDKLAHEFVKLKENLKTLEDYTSIKIRDSKNEKSELNFLSKEERLKNIKELYIIDVSQNQNKKYKIEEVISKI